MFLAAFLLLVSSPQAIAPISLKDLTVPADRLPASCQLAYGPIMWVAQPSISRMTTT
jgi:hypothetical protein